MLAMTRPLRLEFEDAIYHVTARGNRREPIFQDDSDRRMLLGIVGQALERFDATTYAYCLMENHYHFVLRTRQPNLSRLMRHINGVYTQAFNRRHMQVGHLFQGRFKALLVDKDAYFLEVCRYVDLNPVRAGIVARPGDWPWSSHRAHVGQAPTPDWLDSTALHGQLSPKPELGARSYARFVAAGRGVRLWDEALSGQIYVGDAQFVRRMQTRVGTSHDREIPKAQRQPAARPLSWYLTQHDRNAAIAMAYLEGGHTQSAIAHATGLSVSRVSRLVSSSEAKGKT
jgi:REP element-mobilizing transposase RayT